MPTHPTSPRRDIKFIQPVQRPETSRQIAGGLWVDLPAVVPAINVLEDAAVRLTIDLVDERLAITGLEVTAPGGLTSIDLRSIRLGELLRDVAPLLVWTGSSTRRGPLGLTARDVELIRLRGPVPESLRTAVDLYRLAGLLAAPPVKYVQDSLGISRATASAWIRRARAAGMLDEQTAGQR